MTPTEKYERAKEVIKFCGDVCGHMDCKGSRGFLEGWEAREEMAKGLIEALEYISDYNNVTDKITAKKALAAFKAKDKK